MLIGEYEHSLDVKGRLIMPVKLREDIGENFSPLAKAIKSDIITAGRDDAFGWALPL